MISQTMNYICACRKGLYGDEYVYNGQEPHQDLCFCCGVHIGSQMLGMVVRASRILFH